MSDGRPRIVGRYTIYEKLGAGGMGAVHFGVLRDPSGPVPVAVKQLLPEHARDPKRVVMLLDEMRLTRLAQHPNVVTVRDFVYDGEEMILVMDYVHGESLRALLVAERKRGGRMPLRIAAAVMCDVLHALHAAHNARDATGALAGLVHRDVTPENVMVEGSGIPRLTDFGVAKAEGRLHATQGAGVKGKLAYLAPEQVGGDVSLRTDIYAAGLIFWEMLAGSRPIQGKDEAELLFRVLSPEIPPITTLASDVPLALEAAITCALASNAEDRHPSAAQFAAQIEAAMQGIGLATHDEIAAWVMDLAGESLRARAARVEELLNMERDRSTGSFKAFAGPSAPPPPMEPVATPAISRPASSTTLAVVGVLMVAALLLFAAFAMARSRADHQAAEPPFPEPLALAPASAPPSVAAGEPVLPKPAVPVPTGDLLADPPPRAPKKPAAARAVPHKDACDPPFVIDAKGIRKYKNECFK
jgi:hypothetical protein